MASPLGFGASLRRFGLRPGAKQSLPYGVEAWWIDNWYKQGKLSNAVYLKVAATIGVGFQRRLGDIRAAERYLREAAVDDHIKAEQLELEQETLDFKSYPEVDHFISLFSPQTRKHRRPMLAIIGGTNLGKSMLAASVLKQVGELVGVESYMEVTVEGNTHLDLTGFDHRLHSGILLDGVGDALFLRTHRETLQGRAKKCKGAQSATNVYAYTFTLARRAVIATFDLSAANLRAFNQHHWLSDDRNVIRLNLESPAFVDTGPHLPPISHSPVQHATKRRPMGSPHNAGYAAVTTLPPLPQL